MNLNQSETKLSIWINPTSDLFGLILIGNSVSINPISDWFGLKTWYRMRMIRIGSDTDIGMNPKNDLYLLWWETVNNRFDLILFNPRQQSEWIWTNPKPSLQSDLGFILINSDSIFGFDQPELGLILIVTPD